jgi:hypothetical protein
VRESALGTTGICLQPFRWGFPADSTTIHYSVDEFGLEVSADVYLALLPLDTLAILLHGSPGAMFVIADSPSVPPSVGIFRPISSEFGVIKRIDVSPGVPLPFSPVMAAQRDVFVAALGFSPRERIAVDSLFTIQVSENDLFGPCLIAVERASPAIARSQSVASSVYDLQPEGMPLKGELALAIKLDPGQATNKHTGLCWFDKEEEEWVWIDEDTANADLAAGPSLGGGLFAALIDTTAPTITGLNLKQGHRYWNKQPRVKFQLEDNLSGFEDDRSIDVRVDGQWLLPELDIEDGDCVATLRGPLKLGKHVLTIGAVDRAGNRIERRVEFDVIERSR